MLQSLEEIMLSADSFLSGLDRFANSYSDVDVRILSFSVCVSVNIEMNWTLVEKWQVKKYS